MTEIRSPLVAGLAPATLSFASESPCSGGADRRNRDAPLPAYKPAAIAAHRG